MMSSKNEAQPATAPMMTGVELKSESREGAGTLGTVVVLVALLVPEVGGAVVASGGGAVVVTGSVTDWQMASDGESSQVDTD